MYRELAKLTPLRPRMFAILPLSTAPNIAPIVIIDPNTKHCKSGHTKEHWNLKQEIVDHI